MRALAGIERRQGPEDLGQNADSDEVRSVFALSTQPTHTRLNQRRMQQFNRTAGRDRVGRGTAFADLAAEGAVTKLGRQPAAPG